MKKIKAFGRLVSREEACEIITNDFICDIIYSENTCALLEILICGWVGLERWSNKELQDYIEDLDIENQPDGKI